MNTHCLDCKKPFGAPTRRQRCKKCKRERHNAYMRAPEYRAKMRPGQRAWKRAHPETPEQAARRRVERQRQYTLAPERNHETVRKWRAKKDALGLCRVCQNQRGEDGTQTRCRGCADEEARKCMERKAARAGGVPVAPRDPAVNAPYVVHRLV